MAKKFRYAGFCEPNQLDMPVLRVFENENYAVIRECGSLEARSESAIESAISFRLQTKTLPLVLRKRLMYQRIADG